MAEFVRKLNLCLHTGGHQASFDDVRAVRTPNATDSWCPIPHHEYVESVLETLRQSQLTVVDSVHALWEDGNRYFGSFQLQNGHAHDDYALVVGLRNSHDKSFPAGLACGSGVFVCDNLAFSGEVKLSRRHTAHIRRDLPKLIMAAVGRLGTLRANQERRIEVYKQREISDAEVHDLLVRSLDCQALLPTRLPAVVKEWREPAHEEFQPRTAWSLFNAFTEVSKRKVSMERLAEQTIPLHGLLDQVCGLRPVEERFEDATIEGGVRALVV
jgi:hypothetical protein